MPPPVSYEGLDKHLPRDHRVDDAKDKEMCWRRLNGTEGRIEEQWRKLSCNNLCYVSRLEATEEVGSFVRRRRSSVSLHPLSRWV